MDVCPRAAPTAGGWCDAAHRTRQPVNGCALPAIARLLDGARGAERRARSHRMVTPRMRSAKAGAGLADGGAPRAARRARRPRDGGAPRAKHHGRRQPSGWWRVAHRSATAGAGPAAQDRQFETV
jgi:hypothetical protein